MEMQQQHGERLMNDRPHDDAMAAVFSKDPAYAVELLNSILEDGDQAELLFALRQMPKLAAGCAASPRKPI
jgi:DNA-binding phage protein